MVFFVLFAGVIDIIVHGFLSYYARRHWHEIDDIRPAISKTVKRMFLTDKRLKNYLRISICQMIIYLGAVLRIMYMVDKEAQMDTCENWKGKMIGDGWLNHYQAKD